MKRDPATPPETFETGGTALVCNQEFLSGIFGNCANDARPIVVSFTGDPARVQKSAWFGTPWSGAHSDHERLSVCANNYFSLATFTPDDLGHYRRQKAHFHALHAIMLDDVGSKIPQDRITLSPSWVVETSTGNYQAGYLLREPLADGQLADELMNAVIKAGLCDPGASGPRSRLARLPVGVNAKYSPQFQCQLVSWNPGFRYSVHELLTGLNVELPTQNVPKTRTQPTELRSAIYEDSVWIPRPDENAVLRALHESGLYKAPLGSGKHDITCPWVHEHTNGVDHGTAYFEPDDDWPIGGFKCLHGHCGARHIRDLLHRLGVEVNAARMKSTIRIVAGEIHRVVDVAERELARSKRYYQRGGLIVTVVTDPGTHETRVLEISQPALVRALAGAANWERFDGRAKEWTRTDPPARHAAVLHDSSGYSHLPVLNGLARQPYLRPDGTLVLAAGYDSPTGIFSVFDARHFNVPEKPTRRDAQAALELLHEVLNEFSFSTDSDRSAALAALLTAAIRPSLPNAPMFHVRAHMVGSGKSYLCELITTFATPQRGTPTTFPADDEECRKLLLAELLRAPAVIEFDNLTTDLVAHKSLCTTLTSEFLTGRILGVSKTATVSTRSLFLSSGNNVGPVQDMARRCITINLDPGVEIPAARTFRRPDLIREILAERGRYVSAALTIICAWNEAGRPIHGCKALAGFGNWSDLCRQPLLWLGCEDPTASVYESIVQDPDRETLGRFLKSWHAVFGASPAMVRDALNQAQSFVDEGVELREIIFDIAGERGEINRRKLGWWIRRHAGRIVDGMRLSRAGGNGSAERWRVEVVS